MSNIPPKPSPPERASPKPSPSERASPKPSPSERASPKPSPPERARLKPSPPEHAPFTQENPKQEPLKESENNAPPSFPAPLEHAPFTQANPKQEPLKESEKNAPPSFPVSFIGAGPGAADLISLRGYARLRQCDLCLYAGSLVPKGLLAHLNTDATAINSASLTLDAIIDHIRQAYAAGQKIVRLHSGDPSIYGAIHEQMRRLDKLAIDYDIVPGIPSFSATAARIKQEWTVPGGAQSVILTRYPGKATPMRPGESLDLFAASGATLIIHLSIRFIRRIIADLTPHYGADAPCLVAYRVSHDDEMILRGTLSTIAAKVKKAKITRTALIIVGDVIAAKNTPDLESALYDKTHRHLFRAK